jgi:preprotein translocase subunit SecF
MHVKFAGPPPDGKIREALTKNVKGDITVQDLSGSSNEVLIGTELKSDAELAAARAAMTRTLEATFIPPQAQSQLDFNNAGARAVADRLRDPLVRNGVGLSDEQLQDLAANMVAFRDQKQSGLLTGFGQLAAVPGVTPQVVNTLQQECFLAQFHVQGVEIVGPKVGGELRWQAVKATLYALAGMLVYIAFRFEWIYGAAAVIAVFHDTLITIGLFSLLNKEISLTVIAALLTLVGYSMNDTIVVFDRIRENLKIMRREKLDVLINRSVNQTLSRTILTSGLTFLTVLALFLFGGEVLHGFSLALVIGIIIGTYSSVFIASPILVFWQDFVEKRKKPSSGPSAPVGAPPVQPARRGSVKAAR